jgi:hypothetical protein
MSQTLSTPLLKIQDLVRQQEEVQVISIKQQIEEEGRGRGRGGSAFNRNRGTSPFSSGEVLLNNSQNVEVVIPTFKEIKKIFFLFNYSIFFNHKRSTLSTKIATQKYTSIDHFYAIPNIISKFIDKAKPRFFYSSSSQ